MYSDHIFGTRNCTRNFIQTWFPEIFFFSFTLKLKCWDILRHIITSQGSLKRKGDHSSQFILQVIINKKYLTEEQQELLKQDVIEFEIKDPF